MSASLDNEAPSSNAPAITPKLPPHYALGLSHVGVTSLWIAIFLFFSYLPLRASDLWGHAMWGGWILDHHALPAEDPFFPLAEGMRVVDSAWLSQVALAGVERTFGAEGLSALFSLLVVGSLLLFARTFFLLSRRLLPMMLGVVLVLVIGWSRATTLRPENFGVLCLAALLWIITRDAVLRDKSSDHKGWLAWIGVPVIFCLWANLHGSYLVGLVFLACLAVGQAIEVWITEKSFTAIFRNANVQRTAFLAELAVLATLINPYGFDLLVYNLRFAQHPNLAGILEWQPLVILGIGGRGFALSILLLLVLWRFSRARVTPTQVLLLLAFAYLSLKSMRMLGWYAPLYVWATMPHIADLWSRISPPQVLEPQPIADSAEYKLLPGRSFHYTLLCGLVVWIGFSFAPWGSLVLGGKSRSEERLYERLSSPPKLTAYLVEHPPQGQTFHPQLWGDWFVKRVPGFRPFMTSNIHLAPRMVWQDYERVSYAQPGWQRVLDRYDVNTLIVDKTSQPILLQAVKQVREWRNVHEDEQGIVYQRTPPAPKDTKDPAPEPSAEQAPGGERPDSPAKDP